MLEKDARDLPAVRVELQDGGEIVGLPRGRVRQEGEDVRGRGLRGTPRSPAPRTRRRRGTWAGGRSCTRNRGAVVLSGHAT